MSFQIYYVHLLNSEVITIDEDYDLPFEKGLIANFKKAKAEDIIVLKRPLLGNLYVPKRSIDYISEGDVRVV